MMKFFTDDSMMICIHTAAMAHVFCSIQGKPILSSLVRFGGFDRSDEAWHGSSRRSMGTLGWSTSVVMVSRLARA
jgi:hypothetical protein